MIKRIVNALIGLTLLGVATAAWLSYHSINPRQFFATTEQRGAPPAGLSDLTDYEVIEATWEDALGGIAESCGVAVEFDRPSIESLGLFPHERYSFRSNGIPLETLVRLFLRRVDPKLTHQVTEGKILVTTRAAILRNPSTELVTRLYPLDDLTTATGSISEEQLAELISDEIPSTVWNPDAIPQLLPPLPTQGSVEVLPSGLLVTQTVREHRRIERLLKKVREAVSLEGYGAVSLTEYAESERSIRDSLRRNVDLVFDDFRLDLALSEISRRYEIPIWLEEDDWWPEGRFTFDMRDVPLDLALELMLEPLALGFSIEDGVLLIASADKVPDLLSSRLYNVADIPRCVDRYEGGLDGLLMEMIACPMWSDFGGTGDVRAMGDLLWVRQTPEIHERIEDFLKRLERANRTTLNQIASNLSTERQSETCVTQRQRHRRELRDRIEAAMDTANKVYCYQRPIDHVAREIRELYDIPVFVNFHDGGSEFGRTGVKMSISSEDSSIVTLRDALSTATRDASLEFRSCRGVLEIGLDLPPIEELRMAVYPIGELADPLRMGIDGATLQDVIIETIEPNGWNDFGGEGHVAALEGLLIVTQTDPVHEMISELLTALRRIARDGEIDEPIDIGRAFAGNDLDPDLMEVRVRVYSLPELQSLDLLNPLCGLILDSIDTEVWDANGGHGAVAVIPSDRSPTLVVSTGPETHEKIRRLVRAMRLADSAEEYSPEIIPTGRNGLDIGVHRVHGLPPALFDDVPLTEAIDATSDSMIEMMELVRELVLRPEGWHEADLHRCFTRWFGNSLVIVAPDGEKIGRMFSDLRRIDAQATTDRGSLGDDSTTGSASARQLDDSLPPDPAATTIRAYDIASLTQGPEAYSAEQLSGMLVDVAGPFRWSKYGGPGGVWRSGDRLLVRQTEEGHRDVARLLTKLATEPNPIAEFDRSSRDGKQAVIRRIMSRLEDHRDSETLAFDIHLLGRLNTTDRRLVNALLGVWDRAVKQNDESTVFLVCSSLSNFGPSAASALERAEMLLEGTTDRALRRIVIRMIVNVGRQASTTIDRRTYCCDANEVITWATLVKQSRTDQSHCLPFLLRMLSREHVEADSSDDSLVEAIEALDPDFDKSKQLLEIWQQDGRVQEAREVLSRLLWGTRFSTFGGGGGGRGIF